MLDAEEASMNSKKEPRCLEELYIYLYLYIILYNIDICIHTILSFFTHPLFKNTFCLVFILYSVLFDVVAGGGEGGVSTIQPVG